MTNPLAGHWALLEIISVAMQPCLQNSTWRTMEQKFEIFNWRNKEYKIS